MDPNTKLQDLWLGKVIQLNKFRATNSKPVLSISKSIVNMWFNAANPGKFKGGIIVAKALPLVYSSSFEN
jgi:hypothetical protein